MMIPVAITISVDVGFLEAPVLDENASKRFLHAMVIVGYDDNKFGGAFQIANSWGSGWGQNGLFWIRYQDVKQIENPIQYVLNPYKNRDLSKLYGNNKNTVGVLLDKMPSNRSLLHLFDIQKVNNITNITLGFSDNSTGYFGINGSSASEKNYKSAFTEFKYNSGEKKLAVLNSETNVLWVYFNYMNRGKIKIQKVLDGDISPSRTMYTWSLPKMSYRFGSKGPKIKDFEWIYDPKSYFDSYKIYVKLEDETAYIWDIDKNKFKKIIKRKNASALKFTRIMNLNRIYMWHLRMGSTEPMSFILK